MRRGLALVVALGLAAGRAPAQALDTAQLRHRADSLLRLYREALTFARVQTALGQARQVGAASATRRVAAVRGEQPVQAGALMVIANQPDSIPLQEVVPRTWGVLHRTYGSRADSLAAQPIRLIVYHSVRDQITDIRGRRVPAGIAPELLERTILGVLGGPRPDSRLARWLGGAVHVPLDSMRARSETYLQLVTGGAAARGCFRGDISRCEDALELHEDSDFYLSVFNAAERQEAVARARDPDMLDQVTKPQYTRCLDGADSACIAFLRAMTVGQVPRPLDGNGRDALMFTVLAMGGDSAYDRLVRDTTRSIISRLEAAANAPIGAVVSRWRGEVLSARPPSPSVPFQDAAFSIGWVGLLVAGAVRSTRWRLG